MTLEALKAKYPVIPAWMFEVERGYSLEQIDQLMALRERAFPKTAPKSRKAK